MKKNKFMAVFAAAAIAFTSIITPTDIGTDLDLTASAAAGEVKHTGGITLTRVGATDVFETDADYVGALKPKDLVQLNIYIPNLETNLVDLTLRVAYTSTVFDVVQWVKYGGDEPGGSSLPDTNVLVEDTKNTKTPYKTASGLPTDTTEGTVNVTTASWEKAGNYIKGFSGEVGYDNGLLTIVTNNPENSTSSTNPIFVFDENYVKTQYSTAYSKLYQQNSHDSNNPYFVMKAILRVKGAVSEASDFTVELINTATVAYHDANDEPNGTEGGITATYFTYDEDPDNGDVADQKNVWEPTLDNSRVTGKITNAVIRLISGIDFEQLTKNADGKPLNWKGDVLTIKVQKPKATGGGTGNDPFWDDPEEQEIEYEDFKTVEVKLSSDGKTGTVEIRGMTPGVKYKLIPDIWCTNSDELFLTPRDLFVDDYNVSVSGKKPDAIDIKLYGDVDHNGVVASKDATLALKFIVGKNINNIITYSNGAGNDGYKAANVYTADLLNARDATQILRKTAGKYSIFDSMPA